MPNIGYTALRIEAVRREHAIEPLDGLGMHRLGGVAGDLPRRQVEPLRGLGAEAADAQVEREVRQRGDLAAILLDRLEPDQRALHECGRRHQHAAGADIERLERAQDQAHVVIERDPAHEGRCVRGAERQPDHLEISQQIVVRDHDALRIGGRARGVLQERDGLALRSAAEVRRRRSDDQPSHRPRSTRSAPSANRAAMSLRGPLISDGLTRMNRGAQLAVMLSVELRELCRRGTIIGTADDAGHQAAEQRDDEVEALRKDQQRAVARRRPSATVPAPTRAGAAVQAARRSAPLRARRDPTERRTHRRPAGWRPDVPEVQPGTETPASDVS